MSSNYPLISSLLVFAGAILLVLSIFATSSLLKLVGTLSVKKTWKQLYSVMFFFLFGFLLAIYIILLEKSVFLELLIGVIFCLGAFFVLKVVTTSIKTFKELKETETRFSHMIKEVQDYAIIMLDTEGNILNWNNGAEKIKGYNNEEIIDKNFRVFYTEKDNLASKPDNLLKIAADEGRVRDEGWRVKKDGSQFWGSVTITSVHDNKGAIIGYTKVTHNLTERKKAEAAQKKYMHNLEAKNRELEQFVYIASHDLQEPLVTMSGLVEMLDRAYADKLDESGRQNIKYLKDTSDRMSRLIKGLLDYGRIGNEKTKSIVDCNRLLDEVEDDLRIKIEETNAEVKREDLPELAAYETELRLLFQNLISNAIKFRREDVAPIINISAIKQEGYWQFSVKDNGIGIEEKHLDKVFVIFQQLHDKNKYRGTGIGLAHCRKIVELHNGKIWVESEPGKGSIFYFTIKL